jgi:hypothetical protein
MRRTHDYYPTEKNLTLGMLNFCGPYLSGTINEPCNGEGHISSLLREHGLTVITSDIERDARFSTNWLESDWTITNPPFNYALEIMKLAKRFSRKGIIFLTRISFLEPTYARSEWWDSFIPDLVIINPRTSFTDDGKTDSTTTCWICYGDFGPNKGIRFISKWRDR